MELQGGVAQAREKLAATYWVDTSTPKKAVGILAPVVLKRRHLSTTPPAVAPPNEVNLAPGWQRPYDVPVLYTRGCRKGVVCNIVAITLVFVAIKKRAHAGPRGERSTTGLRRKGEAQCLCVCKRGRYIKTADCIRSYRRAVENNGTATHSQSLATIDNSTVVVVGQRNRFQFIEILKQARLTRRHAAAQVIKATRITRTTML